MSVLDRIERTIGSTGLSIGTHLMCESIFPTLEKYDKEREIPNVVDLKKYKGHFFNLYTLIRNVVNSYNDSDKEKILNQKDLIYKILDEMYLLESMYNKGCKLVFYFCNYDKAIKAFNVNKDLKDYSRHIKHVFFTNYIRDLLKKNSHLKNMVLELDHRLPKLKEKILITTHFAMDLCNKVDMDLLETHSGKLKTKSLFNTKYHAVGKMDLSGIPFIEDLLYLMGDDTLVKITPLSLRKDIAATSIIKNWTVMTTRYKILSDISKIDGVKDLLNKFRNPY